MSNRDQTTNPAGRLIAERDYDAGTYTEWDDTGKQTLHRPLTPDEAKAGQPADAPAAPVLPDDTCDDLAAKVQAAKTLDAVKAAVVQMVDALRGDTP